MSIGIKSCIDCVAPKRNVGCHSRCKTYKDQVLERDQVLEKMKAEKEIERQLRIRTVRKRY